MNLSVTEIAVRSGLSRSTVQSRAEREAWPHVLGLGQGGKKKLYPFGELPEDVAGRIVGAAEGSGAPANFPLALKPQVSSLTPDRVMNDPKLSRPALARAALARAYQAEVKKAPAGEKVAARERFVAAFNMGLTYTELAKVLGNQVTRSSLERWCQVLKETNGDAFALADRRGRHRKGQSIVTAEQAEILLTAVLHPNRPTVIESIRLAKSVMAQRGISNGHSEATYRRFVKDWKKDHVDLWAAMRGGQKVLNDSVLPYLERDWSLLEVGDCLIADGHNLNFEIADPWTGKAKRMTLVAWQDARSRAVCGFEIMPTENTAVIASALRRAIIALGRVPRTVYLDNGKAFQSRFFAGSDLSGLDGLFGRLGIQTVSAWPYHGQSKPIERLFKTFGECERWMPSYSGTSIEQKPARMHRNERFHKDLHQAITNGQAPTLAQAYLAVDAWLSDYHTRPHKGLDGQTPLELLEAGRGDGHDLEKLSFLMMAIEVRTISRNGISLMGRTYYDEALYGRRHRVTVRYDLGDPGAVLVYDDQGEFLCEAREMQRVHPMAGALGTAEDRAQVGSEIARKRSLEKRTLQQARSLLRGQVGPSFRDRLDEMGLLPGGDDLPQTPAIVADLPVLPADLDRIEAEAKERIAAAEAAEFEASQPRFENDFDRYESILKAEAQGLALDDEDASFSRYYRISDEHRANASYFQERAAAFSILFNSSPQSQSREVGA